MDHFEFVFYLPIVFNFQNWGKESTEEGLYKSNFFIFPTEGVVVSDINNYLLDLIIPYAQNRNVYKLILISIYKLRILNLYARMSK